jgi:hypothetical protein
MLRRTLIEAISEIATDLRTSDIVPMLTHAITSMRPGSDKAGPPSFSFEPIIQLSSAVRTYPDEYKVVLKIMDLENISSGQFWQKLILNPEARRELIDLRSTIIFAVEQLPTLIELLRQGRDWEPLHSSVDAEHVATDKTTFRLLLAEEEGTYSSPERVIMALEAVHKLYRAVASIEGVVDSDLVIVACDSGSDKSFDFLGLAKLMEQLKEIVLSIWDRVVLHRQVVMGKNLEIIAQSLPILAEVDDLGRRGKLQQEQCELVKRLIVEGAVKFLEAGAYTPEMERESAHSPRLLMQPERKLLAAPTAATRPTRESARAASDADVLAEEDPLDDELSADELGQLRSLLRTAREDNGGRSEAAARPKPVRRPRREPR